MDRSKALNLPNDQINFIKYVCLPAYELVAKGLPNTMEMVTSVRYGTMRTIDCVILLESFLHQNKIYTVALVALQNCLQRMISVTLIFRHA